MFPLMPFQATRSSPPTGRHVPVQDAAHQGLVGNALLQRPLLEGLQVLPGYSDVHPHFLTWPGRTGDIAQFTLPVLPLTACLGLGPQTAVAFRSVLVDNRYVENSPAASGFT